MGRYIKWTEKKILELSKEGRGTGTGADYKPWLDVRSFSSLGRSRRVFSPKTGRVHHLFSDIEYRLFIALEWQQDIVDIREQYPLDRELTQTIASRLGVRHPYYPGTHVPTVMTADMVVTREVKGIACLEAFNAKSQAEAEDKNSMEKLEIQRIYFQSQDIRHHLVFDSLIPRQRVKNIDWIRDSIPKGHETERFEGYWASMEAKMLTSLHHVQHDNRSLVDFCSAFDAEQGAEKGTGIRAARILMSRRLLRVDLAAPDIPALPVWHFSTTQVPTLGPTSGSH